MSDSELNQPSGSRKTPFKLRVYDGDGNEHEFGPIWVEIPEPEPWVPVPDDHPGAHWEHLCRMEEWAKNFLFEDADCSFDTDALLSENAEVRDGQEPSEISTNKVLPRDCRTCRSSANFAYGAEVCDKGFLPSWGDRCREWNPSARLTAKQNIKERIIHFFSMNDQGEARPREQPERKNYE